MSNLYFLEIADPEVSESRDDGLMASRHPVLDVFFRGWLMLGALLWLAVPPLRTDSGLFGSLAYWLLLAPMLSLALMHRQAILLGFRSCGAVLRRVFLVRPSRHRPRSQARLLLRTAEPQASLRRAA